MKKSAFEYKYLNGSKNFKKQVPFYIDNFLTNQEIVDLKKAILDSNNTSVNSTGTDYFNFICPDSIEKKSIEIGNDVYDLELKLLHKAYIAYKYNSEQETTLSPHIDNTENIITIDYCLDTNIDWPLTICDIDNNFDCNDFSIRPNQALVFSGINQVHWRPKRIFSEGEFCDIVVLSLSSIETDIEKYNNSKVSRTLKHLEINKRPEIIDAFKKYNGGSLG